MERPRERLQFYSPAEKFAEFVATINRNRNRQQTFANRTGEITDVIYWQYLK